MANKPFEYTIINPLERPTSTDINQLQAQAHYDVRQFAYELFARQTGFLGYSFNVEPAVPADGTFWVQQGVAFQYGAVESNIGGIAGLSDGYRQKAVTIENRNFTAEPVPSGMGEKRYDLLMIRALEDTERLTDSTNVGIFTPSLVSFDAVSKYKTLTSSLTAISVEKIVQPVVGTGPLVYKSGITFTGAWDPVNKPTVDTGYLGVAYIRRYEGQTSITAADIEDARTLLTVPAMAGGSGASSVGDAGAIAYSNGTNLEFIRASVFGIPQTGRILVSGGASAPTWLVSASASSLLVSGGVNVNPTWITPGVDESVLFSNGTNWESVEWTRYHSTLNAAYTVNVTSVGYTAITQLELADIALRKGMARVELQPNNAADPAGIFWAVGSPASYEAVILISITSPTASTQNFAFRYQAGNNQDYPISLPGLSVRLSEAADYTISVSAKVNSASDSTLTFKNCDLVVSQG